MTSDQHCKTRRTLVKGRKGATILVWMRLKALSDLGGSATYRRVPTVRLTVTAPRRQSRLVVEPS